jgi:hypothetical protein
MRMNCVTPIDEAWGLIATALRRVRNARRAESCELDGGSTLRPLSVAGDAGGTPASSRRLAKKTSSMIGQL